MILTVYVVTALLATAAFIIVGYGINNGMAAASITTQQQSSTVSEQRSSDSDSTVIQQSSGQSQSSSTSSSVITSESSSGEGISSSNRIVTSTGNDNLQIDGQSSGKIEVEAILFGDWSLNGTSGFVDNFIYKPSNGTAPIEYKMSGLELHSINQINDNLVLAGTIDVASNSTAVLQDTPVTIMIQNGILAVGFGNATQATDLFGGIPILGFEQ
jgi:hypothetical protein